MGSFEATRFATGRKNKLSFEIYGSKGSITFDLERMNELMFFSAEDTNTAQGFRKIMVTESEHPYVKSWWPPGHIIGYEHSFIHAVVDFIDAVENNKPISPNFSDGLAAMKVLEAGLQSAETKQQITLNS